MNELVEIWKPVVGWEDSYMVSSFGRVKSLDREVQKKDGSIQIYKEKIKEPTPGKNGYLRVNLYAECKYKTCLVHRLVAEAFLPNPENKPQVDHIDGNRNNNALFNLQYVDKITNQLNPNTRTKMSLSHKGKPSNWHKDEKKKIQFNTDGKIIKIWDTTNDAKDLIGISRQVINDACSGRCKSAGGYKWQYLDDYLADWLYNFQLECEEKERVA